MKGRCRFVEGLSATALVMFADCEYICGKRRRLDKDEPARNSHVRECELLLPHLVGIVDFSGVHGPDGKTLMHFAREMQIAQWHIDHGSPCHVRDDEGRPPEAVLPRDVAVIVNRQCLKTSLPQATSAEVRPARRL